MLPWVTPPAAGAGRPRDSRQDAGATQGQRGRGASFHAEGNPASNGSLLSIRKTVMPPVIEYTSTRPTAPGVDSTASTTALSEFTTTMAGWFALPWLALLMRA